MVRCYHTMSDAVNSPHTVPSTTKHAARKSHAWIPPSTGGNLGSWYSHSKSKVWEDSVGDEILCSLQRACGVFSVSLPSIL
ncbi:unnamed protein product [Aspergillus oryzae]|uniref:Unnamed protein product n=1 Tax=Aspergillus oryzae TaxID=5062 RepID=A0AAN4YDV4_ASPOZ|nr:unnamed protein product [Aspergillus oryzae]